MSATYQTRPDGVAIVTLSNPPVNSLSQAMLNSLSSVFKQIESDTSVKGLVVTGASNTFCGGAEIAEFEAGLRMMGGKATPAMAQFIHDVINQVDSCSKTVVAAIRGVALGGGCELSMACHYRVADTKAQIGLPEINLGLVPGGQGTQRLSRLVPLEFALQLMLGGMPVPVEAAKKAGLIDEVCAAEQLIETACRIALTKPVRRVSAMPLRKIDRIKVAAGGIDQGAVTASKLRKGNPAVVGVSECLKACFNAPNFTAGCKTETEIFARLVSSKESAALRYFFFAERAAAKIESWFSGGTSGNAPPIKSVGIVGSGLMGGGIAMCFLNKSIPVILLDAKQEFLDKGLDQIKKNYQSSVSSRKLSEQEMQKRLSLLTGSIDYSDFRDCDFIIEAVFEDLELKKSIFKKLDSVCKPSCILATNTSSLDIDAIAAVTGRPDKVMGTHFFSPANVMRLLENVKTMQASASTLAACQAMGKQIGKVAVLVGNCDGFVGNRMMGPYSAEAKVLLEEGAEIAQIDAALTDFGFPMGPLSLADLVGLELFWRMRQARGNMKLETKVSIGPYEVGDWLCEKGRYGQKTGRGFYIYGKERGDKRVDLEVVEAINQISGQKGIKRRSPSSYTFEEIQMRLLLPLVNEGCKILEEGMAQRPSDIDVIYIYGFGFPPVKGGPMHWAEKFIGLKNVVEGLRKQKVLAEDKAKNVKGYTVKDYLKVSGLLETCANEGVGLAEGMKRWRAKGTSKL